MVPFPCSKGTPSPRFHNFIYQKYNIGFSDIASNHRDINGKKDLDQDLKFNAGASPGGLAQPR